MPQIKGVYLPNKICSICIATYKREILLQKLLDSIVEQRMPNNICLQVIIIDNDELESAKKVFLKMNNSSNIKFEYDIQPIKNISLARNAGVKKSTGEYILFVDDDGYSETSWVKSLLGCLEEFNADAVFGAVIPYYEQGTPSWIVDGGYFERPIEPRGEKSRYTRTGNCIIKSKLLKSIDGPFDQTYGLTGGEDVNLFGKFLDKGANFISCPEAIIYDYVSKERANLKWLIRRSFRTGNTYTKRIIESSKFKMLTKIFLSVKAILYCILSLICFLIFIPVKIKRIYWLLKFFGNIGHISAVLKINYEEYS